MKAGMLSGLAAALAALGVGATGVQADPIAEFYKDKQLQFIVRSSPGGSFDQYSRLVAGHIVRHIPGNPTTIIRYMTGAAGMQAINYMETVAPHDGTVMTLVNNGLVMDQALGLAQGMKADLKTLNWIGNMTGSNAVMVAWHTSPVKTVAEAKTTPMHLGSAAAGSSGAKFGAVMNNLLGTKFNVIFGYPGNADLNLAMQRGETHGRAGGLWATVKATNPDWIAERKIVPLVQIGLRKEQDLPDVPLLIDLAHNPGDWAVLEFLTKATIVGRPLAVASGVPKERVEALRRAFDRTMDDPAFLAEAERVKAEISPTSGMDVQQLVADVLDAPADVRARAEQAMEWKGDEAQGGKAERK
jgi:tripartite-type tricarboxylate transporter receptor subunit TctC